MDGLWLKALPKECSFARRGVVRVDMFPHTDSDKYAVDIFPRTDSPKDIRSIISSHVETVVRMVRK